MYWALELALGSGLIGASIVFLFLSKVLISEEENMDPADYDMVGVLGRTSIPVREGGTGEIIYSQAGTRRTCGARSEDGVAIAKGVEVVVTRIRTRNRLCSSVDGNGGRRTYRGRHGSLERCALFTRHEQFAHS